LANIYFAPTSEEIPDTKPARSVPLTYRQVPKMVDYSKWNNIEVSDDEDDTHPNIDTPSLFKWRHEARVQREEELKKKQEDVAKEKAKIEAKLKEVKERVKKEEATGSTNLSELKSSLSEVEKNAEEVAKKKADLEKEARSQPLNVDSLSCDGFSRTVINRQPKRDQKHLTEEQKEENMRKFVKENEAIIKEFGMLQKFEDSKKFLMDGRTHLACEETANYLVIQCINLEMEEKTALMEHMAHQCICMQFLLELAKQLDTDPRACISSFFTKIQVADEEYKNAFYEELRAFKERIKKRAAEKVAEAIAEAEEEERISRLGPGGLDPVEVFESLPQRMKECFEKQDIPMLQQVIKELPEDEARNHMKRCVDSGLWCPAKDDPNTNEEDGFNKQGGEEEVYEELK